MLDASDSHRVPIRTELSRDLGLTSALAIGVGTMIAAGIFTLSGLAVRNVGSAAVVAFLMAAGVALFTALTYCEFAAAYPETGEGYLYAFRTFSPLLAYVVGWCLVLGYVASCAFYVASLSTYFHEFLWSAAPRLLAGLVAVALLTALNIKGTKESGAFQIAVTATKVLLLCWFIVGGAGAIDPQQIAARFDADIVKIGGTAAMVFITFFGFSAIAASAGEVKNPVKTIPRAIFISMGAVTLLYTGVVLVLVAADLSEYTEAALGAAARQFLGPVGGMVIVGGAIFSMISASNASIMAGSRVVLSMSRRGHLPRAASAIHPRTRTPVIALLAVGGAVAAFAVALPLEDLAHFADTVLLLALILVNAALIQNRRKHPDLRRPFKVPLVPLLPTLGILANLYLLQQLAHHLLPFGMALGAVAAGFVVYAARGRLARLVSVPARRRRVELPAKADRYRVLVPIAHPDHVPFLLELAHAVAAPRGGELLVMRVVQVPDQADLQLDDAEMKRQRKVLEGALGRATALGAPAHPLIRVAHRVEEAVVHAAAEHGCDLIVMGWKGYTTTRGRILGDVTDAVVRHAPCDILVVKPVGDRLPKRTLLPTAGGPHARRAERYAAAFAGVNGGALTLCRVEASGASAERKQETRRELHEAVARVAAADSVRVHETVVECDSVSGGIIEASEDYDAVVVGAALTEGVSSQLLFGTIPENVAKHVNGSVIMVKRCGP